MIDLIVEGWRFLPHSYSIFNQFQCLEFLRRTREVNLFHKDFAYLYDRWKPIKGLFNTEEEIKLKQIPAPLQEQRSNVTLRIAFPYNLEPANSDKTFVFGTVEGGVIFPFMLSSSYPLPEALNNSDVVIVTPSQWSKKGFINSGAPPERVIVIPHGIDPNIYHPLSSEERQRVRQELGWDGFVFLNIGSMFGSKGIHFLLKAFAIVVEQYPEAQLVLKGLDSLYTSLDHLNELFKDLTVSEIEKILPRLTYIGESLSFAEMAQLYQAADVYVSPYMSEGFNMPVLEAVACGLPVICTKGGPTDDFTNSHFALQIDSTLERHQVFPGYEDCWIFKPNLDHLIELMKQSIEDEHLRQQAQVTGVEFVQKGFTYDKIIDRFLVHFKG